MSNATQASPAVPGDAAVQNAAISSAAISSAAVSSAAAVPSAAEPRALRILAKSVFRELKSTGYSRSDIVSFATEMLSLVSSDIRGESIDEP